MVDKLQEKFANPVHKTFDSFDKPDRFVDDIYIRNLKTLRALSENIDAFAVFVPQVLNYADYNGKGGSREWTRHINDRAVPVLMDKFNAYMNGLCPQGKYNCVVFNEILEKNWLPNDFVDDGHFSRSGGLKFSEAIYQSIIQGKFNGRTVDASADLSTLPDRGSREPAVSNSAGNGG